MIRPIALLAAASPLVLAPAPLPAARTVETQTPPSLCHAGEEVIFACRIGAKRVSVCGGQAGGQRYAQYRFGAPGKLELVHPADGTAGAGDLRFAHIAYSGGGEGQVSFANRDVRYVAYSRMTRTRFDGKGNDPAFDSGVVVLRGDKPVASMHCSPRDDGNVDWQLAEKYLPEGEPVDLP